MAIVTLWPLVTKFLTFPLTCELDNPLDDWLESTGPNNHPADFLIQGLTRELPGSRITPFSPELPQS